MRRLTKKRLELLHDLAIDNSARITHMDDAWGFVYHFACDDGYARVAETDVKVLIDLELIYQSYKGGGATVWKITDAGRIAAGPIEEGQTIEA